MSGNGVFNSVSANGMNVTGILQASQIITTQPMQVSNLSLTGALNLVDISASGSLKVQQSSNLYGALNVTGVSTLYDINSTGTLDVTGSTSAEVPVLNNPIVNGDLTVSGNVYVGGNVFAGLNTTIGSVLNSTGLVPYGTPIPDSTDVYQLPSRYANYYEAGDVQNNVFEHEIDKSIPIWDENRTHVISYGTAPKDSKSYLLSYPTGNVNTPHYTSINDTANISNAYKITYSTAPTNMDYTLHYSLYQSNPGDLFFSENDIFNTLQTITSYAIDRGQKIPIGDFPPEFNHAFTSFNNGSPLGIEFGYNSSQTVPSNVYLSFSYHFNIGDVSTQGYLTLPQSNVGYGSFLLSSHQHATDPNICIIPVTIPVTTDSSAFSSAYGQSNTKLALWDPAQHHIHIYFKGSSNTHAVGSSNSSFNSNTYTTITWDNNLEMASFYGSFAVMKKRNMITTTERPFTLASTGERGAFLMQISNVVTFSSNAYMGGVIQTSSSGKAGQSGTFTRALYDSGSNYTGIVLPKVGYGKNSFDVSAYYYGAVNAFDNQVTEFAATTNPYINIPTSDILPVMINFYQNSGWPTSLPTLTIKYSNLYTDTPEQMYANMNGSCISIPANGGVDTIAIHEFSHSVHLNTTYNEISEPSEGIAVNQEMDAYKNGVVGALCFFRGIAHAATLYTYHRGSRSMGTPNYSYFLNNIHTYPGYGFNNNSINGQSRASYGEAIFFNHIVNKYDTLNQIHERTNDIFDSKITSVFNSSGIPRGAITSVSPKGWQLAYDQAVREMSAAQGSPTTLANVFTDFMVSSVILRNNASIPDKYKASFPYWSMYNRRAPYYSNVIAGLSPTNTFLSVIFWSDLEEGRPGQHTGSSFSRKRFNSENDTIIPIWPKTGSLFSNGLIHNNLGSWDSTSAPTTFTYTSNTYINTPLEHTCEDLCGFSYVIPTFSNASANVYGTQHYISNVAITVGRGDWAFKVVQFIPNGGDGIWHESTQVNVNVPGVYDPTADSWSDGTPQTIDVNFSDFSTNCKGPNYGEGFQVYYFPRLVCVNKGNYTGYAPERNFFPPKLLYTGHLIMQATVV